MINHPFRILTRISAVSILSFAAVANDISKPAGFDPTIRRNTRVPGDLTLFELDSRNTDLAITSQIREEITVLKNLSANARNVKIITTGGRVVLQGVVNTAEEKRLIGDIAIAIQRRENVANRLKIRPNPSAPTGLRVIP